MDSLATDDEELFKNSISYLHNISGLNFSPPALKSIYLTKARLMELRGHIRIPSREKTRCERCLLNWNDGPPSHKIRAEQKKSKFARRVLAKKAQDKPLTKYQRRYVKQLDPHNGNQLVITCKFCQKETLVKLNKPKNVVDSQVVKKLPKKRKRNKIKKKDKFSGLDQDVVLSLTPNQNKRLSKVKSNKTEIVTKVATKKNKSVNASKVIISKVVKKPLKKKEIINKDKTRHNQRVLSLTPGNVRNLDSLDFIALRRNNRVSKIILKKKENVTKAIEEVPTKESIRKDQNKLKKKNKLKEFLNTSGASKSRPSTNLKHFLQTL